MGKAVLEQEREGGGGWLGRWRRVAAQEGEGTGPARAPEIAGVTDLLTAAPAPAAGRQGGVGVMASTLGKETSDQGF